MAINADMNSDIPLEMAALLFLAELDLNSVTNATDKTATISLLAMQI